MAKVRILYVEDEPFLGRIVKESLESRDFEVHMSADGNEAVGLYHSLKPDLCVLDIMLPHQDGYAIARQIRENNPAVPIIFVTAKTQTDDLIKGFEVGGNGVVRDDAGRPSSDPERFARLLEGLRKHCPGMIVQFSTGGRSGAGRERGGMLSLRPDMASLAVGSNNFPTRVYENPPDLVDWLAGEMITYGIKPEIEAFDLS
ncbi:MAG TPA: hypothetical protein DDZ56_09105, partial [Cytophagales bacterium]|nr:hypothetical protein [Cytophagales bacterium]